MSFGVVSSRARCARETAVRGFRWPAQERFNWALDYFDAVATGNDRPALHILDEDGTETIRRHGLTRQWAGCSTSCSASSS